MALKDCCQKPYGPIKTFYEKFYRDVAAWIEIRVGKGGPDLNELVEAL